MKVISDSETITLILRALVITRDLAESDNLDQCKQKAIELKKDMDGKIINFVTRQDNEI